jgi:hypothetical protein
MDQTPIPTTPVQPAPEVQKMVIHPSVGEVITSLATGNSYTMGEKIGEGSFGVVYSCGLSQFVLG